MIPKLMGGLLLVVISGLVAAKDLPTVEPEQQGFDPARLDRLTPGDFQTVLRRRRLIANASVVGFVEALAAEQAGKRGDASRSIGFVHSH